VNPCQHCHCLGAPPPQMSVGAVPLCPVPPLVGMTPPHRGATPRLSPWSRSTEGACPAPPDYPLGAGHRGADTYLPFLNPVLEVSQLTPSPSRIVGRSPPPLFSTLFWNLTDLKVSPWWNSPLLITNHAPPAGWTFLIRTD